MKLRKPLDINRKKLLLLILREFEQTLLRVLTILKYLVMQFTVS